MVAEWFRSMWDDADYVETAMQIMLTAHKGQKDKLGVPYFLHPLMVASKFPDDPIRITVALLHDVVEDTHWTIEMLRKEGIPEEALEAIDAISQREGESKQSYLFRVCDNEVARDVKHEDVVHNSDTDRLSLLTDVDTIKRLSEKYGHTKGILIASWVAEQDKEEEPIC